MTRLVALLLTALTGMSGLVYEVAWQKALATLLGSQSEATAAVLAIFLGGLAVGYWVFGRVTRSLVVRGEARGEAPRLLFVYGTVELTIGLYVFVFPWLFAGVQALSFAMPHGPAGVGFAVDIALAALLIGPPSVLMGGTIPMLTQALSRNLADATRFHALVYAFNTAGAFVGALAAGYYLVPALGLVDVMRAMGILNLVAGSIFLILGWRPQRIVTLDVVSESEGSGATGDGSSLRMLCVVALLTGFAMMSMQTIVIRIGGLAFGASQFTFSTVVAVFVLCIALGSFIVSALPRIPKLLVTANQWGLALLFSLLYFQIEEAPYRVYLLRTLFRNLDAAFGLFHFTGFLMVLAVVGPAVVLSGASLPLLFHYLRQRVGHLGDLAGVLYSWNTVGSLAGALLGGYALLYWMDLHDVYRLALATLVVAAALLSQAVHRQRIATVAATSAALLGILFLPAWNPQLLTLGLFRMREPRPVDWLPRYEAQGRRIERQPNHELYAGLEAFLAQRKDLLRPRVVFHEDDPIATITLLEQQRPDGGKTLSIVTNGKNDSNATGDYQTTALLALVPALLAQKAESAFVIGWGTGVTVGELAALEDMRRIDVAEISPAVVRAAPLFDKYNRRAFHDPRVHIVRSDAYRALMRSSRSYDLIVSEPSNPWVLGVELVYTREFLEAARDKLEPGGVFCQWIHTYEMDDPTLALVLRTYAEVFDHIAVWVGGSSDLMLLGLDSPSNATDVYRLEELVERPDLKAALQRADVDSFPELLAHEVLPVGVVHALPLEGPIHTLLHPRLNDMAGRAFFRGGVGRLPFSGFGEAAQIGAQNSLVRRYSLRFPNGLPDQEWKELFREACKVQFPQCLSLLAARAETHPDSESYTEVHDLFVKRMPDETAKQISLARRLSATRSLPPGDLVSMTEAKALTESFRDFYLHASPMSGDRLVEAWRSCREKKIQCERGLAKAELLLEEGRSLPPWQLEVR